MVINPELREKRSKNMPKEKKKIEKQPESQIFKIHRERIQRRRKGEYHKKIIYENCLKQRLAFKCSTHY